MLGIAVVATAVTPSVFKKLRLSIVDFFGLNSVLLAINGTLH
jgi:hypothetical protein